MVIRESYSKLAASGFRGSWICERKRLFTPPINLPNQINTHNNALVRYI